MRPAMSRRSPAPSFVAVREQGAVSRRGSDQDVGPAPGTLRGPHSRRDQGRPPSRRGRQSRVARSGQGLPDAHPSRTSAEVRALGQSRDRAARSSGVCRGQPKPEAAACCPKRSCRARRHLLHHAVTRRLTPFRVGGRARRCPPRSADQVVSLGQAGSALEDPVLGVRRADCPQGLRDPVVLSLDHRRGMRSLCRRRDRVRKLMAMSWLTPPARGSREQFAQPELCPRDQRPARRRRSRSCRRVRGGSVLDARASRRTSSERTPRATARQPSLAEIDVPFEALQCFEYGDLQSGQSFIATSPA